MPAAEPALAMRSCWGRVHPRIGQDHVHFVALATDYDGTLAEGGRVAHSTLEALKEVRATGRRLILVTGRVMADLVTVFPDLEAFDLIVAENGATLYEPATRRETPLTDPPHPGFVDALRRRDVAGLSVGTCIVATWEPHETAVLEAIRDLGLELQITFNKGAVMVLPSGVNKASGLAHALDRLSLSPLNVAGIGDAENDQAFLSMCGAAVAVANALPAVKSGCDLVVADHGAGVRELCRLLIETDLAHVRTQAAARHIRKYAAGELGDDKSFYFRGPRGALNLKAQNPMIFLQVAAGVDEETWRHHLQRGDYSRWFRDGIKDEELAAEVEQVERAEGLAARESRDRIREAVERRYTAPARAER